MNTTLCRGMSELGHTLVVKHCLCNWRSQVQTPVGANCSTIGRVKDTIGKFLFLFLFFLFFWCFVFVPLMGIPEKAGLLQRVSEHTSTL